MSRFTVVPQDTFKDIQINAGVILNSFDPANPAVPEDEDIICATTGNITATCVPTYADFGEDINNVQANTKELKKPTGWTCTLGFTALGFSPEVIRMSLGAADITAESGKIQPRDLKLSDFIPSVWWVGDRTDGGLVAVELKNALSTSGFSLQTTKNGKGQITVTLTGHVSIQDAEGTVPMTMYSQEGEEGEEEKEDAGGDGE